jgi:replicative DNA helicase
MPDSRLQPFDEEAEIAVLGACTMNDPIAVAQVLETLVESDFYLERHRFVFRAIESLFSRSSPVETVTVQAELRDHGLLDKAGGVPFLSELLDAVPTTANVHYHARIVRDHSTRRRMIAAGTDIVRLGHAQDGRSASELLDAAGGLMYSASQRESGGLVAVRKAMMPAFAIIERAQDAKGGITGVGTGYYDLDEMTGGWQKGNLIVVAARPSMGKTALTTGVTLHAAIQQRVGVAVFSLEMTKEELVQRMLCHEALVDLGGMLRGRMQEDEYVRLAHAATPLSSAPIWIDDTPDLTITQIRAKARRLKVEQPDMGLVVVDYLQLMRGDGENRTQEVSGISRGLKALAKELALPVIALSQLSRKCEERSDKRPMLSDLRESGAIEQDADIVAFLYRPEKYYGTTDSKGNNIQGHAELIVSKQRNGPTGTVPLFFRDYCARFENMAKGNLRVAS